MAAAPAFVLGTAAPALGRSSHPSVAPVLRLVEQPRAANNAAPVAATAAAATGIVAGIVACAKARSRQRRRLDGMKAGFGPQSYDGALKDEAVEGDIGQRIKYLIDDNEKGIRRQLDQYGYAQVDGFLGGAISGFPDQIRDELDKLFARGWFETESEADRTFKVGGYRITNQDEEHRFKAALVGAAGDDATEKKVESQYDVAPTVVQFVRALMVSLADPIGRACKGGISTNIGAAEMFALCGNGARYDRRVSNVHGWRTEAGYAPDKRKLTVFYFTNPAWREELGGHLQLEGVITPTGAAAIAPLSDRLVMFWSDRTVWSMRQSRANTMREHSFGVKMDLMAESPKTIDYDPTRLGRWFPELQGCEFVQQGQAQSTVNLGTEG